MELQTATQAIEGLIADALGTVGEAGPEAPVLFSVIAGEHASSGQEALLTVPTSQITAWSPPGTWIADSIYVVARDGFYSVSMSYMRDSYDQAEHDDSYLRLYAQGADGIVRNVFYLHDGDQPQAARNSVAASTILRLKRGDRLQWRVGSDLDKPRHLRHIRVSLFEIR
ncbi:MAG: hypothetical protein AAGE18_08345 [Pseudomonadota bacterium]